MAAFAFSYAEQNADHAQLADAIGRGEVEAGLAY